jgi:hypothetical protein
MNPPLYNEYVLIKNLFKKKEREKEKRGKKERENKIFLLAYYICTGGYIVIFTCMLTIYLN